MGLNPFPFLWETLIRYPKNLPLSEIRPRPLILSGMGNMNLYPSPKIGLLYHVDIIHNIDGAAEIAFYLGMDRSPKIS